MRSKHVVVLLMAAMALYLLLLGQRAVWLISEGGVLPVALGIGVLGLPVIGVTILVSEWRFGSAAQRLAEQMAATGWTPEDDPALGDIPTLPSGRLDRAAARTAFDLVRADTEAAPDDWHSWYRLAVAYDLAGDRPQGRHAMRRAIELYEKGP